MEKPPFNHARCSECDATFLANEVSDTCPNCGETMNFGWLLDSDSRPDGRPDGGPEGNPIRPDDMPEDGLSWLMDRVTCWPDYYHFGLNRFEIMDYEIPDYRA